ncbi:unnamed protein product [marine sediment metagenome]|uniref:Uncharacterized protein n=1 Tax=marine sediment metagenome TaxID=412755 RepID=X0ZRB2_9ZZZZ
MIANIPKAYTTPCPRCGFQVPLSVRGCLNCGQIVDPSIIEPATELKNKWILQWVDEYSKAREILDLKVALNQAKINKLGPASKALLERVNTSFGNITLEESISWARAKTGLDHTEHWWYCRLVALALEGLIDASVCRTGDKISIQYRKKRDTKLRLDLLLVIKS